MRRLLALGFLAAAVVLVGSCGGGDDPPTAEFTVSMLDNTFDQDVYEVPVGAVVGFVNKGRNPHNAFAVDGSWSTQDATGDSLMLADETAVLTFDEPGTYEFFCTIHASRQDDGSYEGMVATLIVGESDGTTSQVDIGTDVVDEWTGVTRAVPTDYPTIQSGVDAAEPGDLVLVGPGVYRKAVSVTAPYITIRDSDRNEVILDGVFARENGIAVTADGVAIENVTARNYTINGFFWNGVTVSLVQTERGILEFTLPERGRYMFHPHQHSIAMRGAPWAGFRQSESVETEDPTVGGSRHTEK